MAGRRDPIALEKRRRKAERLLSDGVSQAETARRVGVSRQSVHSWARMLNARGTDGLRRATALGRRWRLDQELHNQLVRELRNGPDVHGTRATTWTIARVRRFIAYRYGVVYRKTKLIPHLLREAGFEPRGRAGWKRRGDD